MAVISKNAPAIKMSRGESEMKSRMGQTLCKKKQTMLSCSCAFLSFWFNGGYISQTNLHTIQPRGVKHISRKGFCASFALLSFSHFFHKF